MTHTPTPWKVYQFGGVQVGQEDTGEAICSMWGDKHEGEANAAHIVKCVNMHDELVEVLKEAGDVIESYYRSTGIDLGDASNMPFYGDTIRKVDEALKKAGAL